MRDDPEYPLLCQSLLRANCSLDFLDLFCMCGLVACLALLLLRSWLHAHPTGTRCKAPQLELQWTLGDAVLASASSFYPTREDVCDVPAFVRREIFAAAAAVEAMGTDWLGLAPCATPEGAEGEGECEGERQEEGEETKQESEREGAQGKGEAGKNEGREAAPLFDLELRRKVSEADGARAVGRRMSAFGRDARRVLSFISTLSIHNCQ